MSCDVPYNVCIILEGNEEYQFFQTMKLSGAISSNIALLNIDAGGFGRVAPYFQDYLAIELFDCVVCVYDVDYRQAESGSPYQNIREGLLKILGNEEAVNAVSFCTNPNFLQIYLLSKKPLNEVCLTQTSKKMNTEYVHLCWPDIAKEKKKEDGTDQTKGYDATEWQLRLMNTHFYESSESYQALLENCQCLPKDYLFCDSPGSNAPNLIRALLEGDTKFFKAIRSKVDED